MSPRVDVAEERRTQIIEAAIACLAREGYHRTTMDDIVHASGLSKGALYWYFPSKEDLFLAILDVWMRELQEATAPADAQAPTPQQLRAWVEAFTRFAEMDPGRVRLIVEFWAEVHRSRAIDQRLGELCRQRALPLVRIIEQGIARGELRPVDAFAVAHTFLAVYDGLLLQRILLPDHLPWPQVNQTAIDVLLNGLQA